MSILADLQYEMHMSADDNAGADGHSVQPNPEDASQVAGIGMRQQQGSNGAVHDGKPVEMRLQRM
jgi:hypothetical protein